MSDDLTPITAGVRRIRTAEGAKRFGKSIGDVITAREINAARKAEGKATLAPSKLKAGLPYTPVPGQKARIPIDKVQNDSSSSRDDDTQDAKDNYTSASPFTHRTYAALGRFSEMSEMIKLRHGDKVALEAIRSGASTPGQRARGTKVLEKLIKQLKRDMKPSELKDAKKVKDEGGGGGKPEAAAKPEPGGGAGGKDDKGKKSEKQEYKPWTAAEWLSHLENALANMQGGGAAASRKRKRSAKRPNKQTHVVKSFQPKKSWNAMSDKELTATARRLSMQKRVEKAAGRPTGSIEMLQKRARREREKRNMAK